MSFYGHNHEKQKGPGTSNHSLFSLSNMFTSLLYLLIYHPSNFNALIQRDSWVMQKIKIDNSPKPFYDVIIIPFSTSSLIVSIGEEVRKFHQKCEI